jgi:hypothetical protein
MVKKFTLFSAKPFKLGKKYPLGVARPWSPIHFLLPATPAQLASAIFIVILKHDPFCRF